MELRFKVFEHAAALIGRTPWEVARDDQLLFQAQAAAYRLYRQQPLIVAIDHYNLAPEAYGAVVARPDGHGLPAILQPVLPGDAALARLRPFDPRRAGRWPMIFDVAERLKREFPEAQVAVPVDGPFSIASALVGFDQLLCDVAENPDTVRDALLRLVEGQVALTAEARARGLGVAFAESAAGPPLLSPALFRRVELPALKTLLDRMSELLGERVACLMGGDTVKILDELLETRSPYLVCPYETDQARFVRRLADRPDILVRVNLHSGIVARGSWDDLRAEADRALAIAQTRPNTIIGAGVLPYETRPANVFRVQDYLASVSNPN
jgi:uroporphyrinogen decarboxylase